jgi:hypothetical protein
MNENKNQTAPKTFDIIDGNTLMAREYEPLQFSVEKILPHGLFILAGSGKIGKSWLSLDLCVSVATGGKLWDFSAEQGDVLYLALEDNHPRLQDRLNKIKAASVDGVFVLEKDTRAGQDAKLTIAPGSPRGLPRGVDRRHQELLLPAALRPRTLQMGFHRQRRPSN